MATAWTHPRPQRLTLMVYALVIAGLAAAWPLGRARSAPTHTLQQATAGDVDARWDPRFGPPGVDGYVTALARDRDGSLIAGGDFRTVGGIVVNGLARWDGSAWGDIGGGVPPFQGAAARPVVYALAADGDNLYVGGQFRGANSQPIALLARWDGRRWTDLSAGIDGPIYALSLVGGALVVGGSFGHVGTIAARNIAHWDGQSWSPLVEGTTSWVAALQPDGAGGLYVGGDFTGAGTTTASRIAHWDGQRWSALGDGMTEGGAVIGPTTSVLALARDSQGRLYAGGSFYKADGQPVNHIARWDGEHWTALGEGVGGDNYPTVTALTFDAQGGLIAGGTFTMADGKAAGWIARWDGAGWHSIGNLTPEGGSGSSIGVSALIRDAEGQIVAGGAFREANGVAALHIARWDGSAWTGLRASQRQGANSSISALLAGENGHLFAGGRFTTIGDVAARSVAEWDGHAWRPLGIGSGYEVLALARDGDDLYVGGRFEEAGGQPASFIARWDGQQWYPLGDGLNGPVHAIVIDAQHNVYVGGEFTRAGSVDAPRVARWDGSAWSAMGTGIVGDVEALALDAQGGLVAGGMYEPGEVARWSGTAWVPLGDEIQWGVRALLVDQQGTLYAGGYFDIAQPGSGHGVAYWDGVRWQALGGGVSAPESQLLAVVKALAVDSQNQIYAAGYFTTAGAQAANSIARWDGQRWNRLGQGLNDEAAALVVSLDDVYAGGWFTIAGATPSAYVARWSTGPLTQSFVPYVPLRLAP